MALPFEGNPLGMIIGNTPANLHSYAIFQLDSTTKGMVMPRMNTAQMNAIPATFKGIEIFNTDTNTKWFTNGTVWVQLTAGGGGLTTASNGLTVVGSDVELGGTLTALTQINPATFGLSIGAALPNPLAVLDLQSTDKGFLLPRLTPTERAALSPTITEESLLVWEVDAGVQPKLYFWSDVDAAWIWIATTQYVIDSLVNTYRGVGSVDGSTSPNYPAGVYGEILQVTVNGFIGGVGGKPITINDFVLCINANAGGNEATVGADWKVYKGNLNTSSFNTNWRGISATDPLTPIAGDWYTNSVNGINYYYDAVRSVWNTNGIIRVTQAQRLLIVSPPTGMQLYQTDLLKGMYEYDGTTWIHRSMSVAGTTAQRPANPVTGQVYFDQTRAKILQWNGSFWQGLKIDTEEYISIGEQLQFVTSAQGGGGATVDTVNVVNAPDLGGATNKQRSGMSRMNITNGNNSRIASGFVSTVNGVSLSINANSYFYYAWELDILNTIGQGVINFANDPVLMGWGLSDTFSTALPLNVLYLRPPRLGETAFIKYVVRTAGIDATLDTAIPYNNTSIGFFKVGLLWDGASDTLTFLVQANGVNSVHPITTFLALNPLLGINYCPVLVLARNGNPIVGVARQMRIDKAHRHIGGNYPDTI